MKYYIWNYDSTIGILTSQWNCLNLLWITKMNGLSVSATYVPSGGLSLDQTFIYLDFNFFIPYIKELLEWIQFKYDMVTLFVKKSNIQKTQTQNMQWKQRYRWKQNRSMTRWNVQHFPPASGWMTPNSVCLWRHMEYGDSSKRCIRGDLSHRKRWLLRRW